MSKLARSNAARRRGSGLLVPYDNDAYRGKVDPSIPDRFSLLLDPELTDGALV